MNPICVLVADDHVYAVEGIAKIISEAGDMKVVGQASTIREAVEAAGQLRPDVVVLDLAWQGDKTAGVKAIPRIREKTPNTRIVAVTVYNELIELARQEGVQALSKGFSKTELLDEIRWAVDSKGRPAVSSMAVTSANDVGVLSDREAEVVKLVALGKTDKEIGKELHIAEGTVKKHIGSILTKLGVSNRTEAAMKASKLGIL